MKNVSLFQSGYQKLFLKIASQQEKIFVRKCEGLQKKLTSAEQHRQFNDEYCIYIYIYIIANNDLYIEKEMFNF